MNLYKNIQPWTNEPIFHKIVPFTGWYISSLHKQDILIYYENPIFHNSLLFSTPAAPRR